MEKQSIAEKLNLRHPERDEKEWQFNFLRDSYTGLGGFAWNQPINDNTIFGRKSLSEGFLKYEARPSYLDRFPLEREDSYFGRLKATSYVNFVSPITDLYNDLLFRRRATRLTKLPNLLNWIIDNNVEVLSKKAVKISQIYGSAFVVIDVPDTSNASNLSDVENWKGPYATVLDPTHILSWDVNDDGEFEWVKYKVEKTRVPNPFSDSVQESTWVIWTKTEFQVWVGIENGEGEPKLISQGPNPFGMVPVAILKLKESMEGKFLGDSPILEVATLTRSFYNRLSELTVLLRGQAFSQLIIPQSPGSQNSEFEVGPNSIIFIDPESKIPPQYISPSSSNSELYEKRLNELQNDIFRAAKLEYLRQQMTGRMQGNVSSGLSRSFSFAQCNSALVAMGKACNAFEKSIAQIICSYYNDVCDYEVEYPNDYELSAGSNDLLNLKESIATQMPPVVLNKLRKNIAQNLVNLTQDEYKTLEEEIKIIQETKDNQKMNESAFQEEIDPNDNSQEQET